MESKREENRTRIRGQILRAATALFSERGFEAVTMSEIAAKAGVVRATVFNHFASKHSLVEAITDDVFAYYGAIVERALDEPDASVPALTLTLLMHMGQGIEHSQQFYSGVFREILRTRAGLAAGPAAGGPRAHALERLERLMARGQERGELRDDIAAAELARAFDALSLGTIVDWLYDEPRGALPDRMRTAARLFLGGASVTTEGGDAVVEHLLPLESTPTGPGTPP